MTNQGVCIGVDVGMLDAIIWFTHNNHSVKIIPNHEDRLSDIMRKYCFGTATLVTPKIKSYLQAIFGQGGLLLNGYSLLRNEHHTIPKGYIKDTTVYYRVSIGDYYNNKI